jgi:hypothetical protein
MKDAELDEMKRLLRSAVPVVRGEELAHDLWPAMLRRLDQHPFHLPWWDWALLAGVTAVFCFFPGLIPALLYHL